MAWLSKDESNTIFLWNNKPEYNYYADIYQAWLFGFEGEKK